MGPRASPCSAPRAKPSTFGPAPAGCALPPTARPILPCCSTTHIGQSSLSRAARISSSVKQTGPFPPSQASPIQSLSPLKARLLSNCISFECRYQSYTLTLGWMVGCVRILLHHPRISTPPPSMRSGWGRREGVGWSSPEGWRGSGGDISCPKRLLTGGSHPGDRTGVSHPAPFPYPSSHRSTDQMGPKKIKSKLTSTPTANSPRRHNRSAPPPTQSRPNLAVQPALHKNKWRYPRAVL